MFFKLIVYISYFIVSGIKTVKKTVLGPYDKNSTAPATQIHDLCKPDLVNNAVRGQRSYSQ